MGLGICLLLVALARPQWGQAVEKERFQARDIILAIDLSGSMADDLRAGGGRKIDLAKEAALAFVERRRGDRIGLLVFGNETYGSWPLSSDLEIIREKIRELRPDLGGTDLAKPLEHALTHFQQLGQSNAKAIILVTDGEAPVPTPLRQEIQAKLTAIGIHLYLLGIDLGESADILDLVSRSGGRVWNVNRAAEFWSRFQEIDRLEPSLVVVEKRLIHRDLYAGFTLGGLACLTLAIVGATLAPRIP
ncbi:MAG: VWA domain-containing protein [Candidatus Rokubacteria bacterium]|nr:VWA domain-containing protein [Candidatus Rokubacteria bacterium]